MAIGSRITDVRHRIAAIVDRQTRLRLWRLGFLTLGIWTVSAVFLYIFEPPSVNAEFTHLGDYLWGVVLYFFSGLEQYAPISLPGKFVAGLTFASAAVFLTVFTAEVLGVIVELARRRGKLPLIDTGLGLKGHIVVCGWSDAGSPLVREINSEVFSHRHTTVIVAPNAGSIPLKAVCPRKSFAPRVWAAEGDPSLPVNLEGAYVQQAAIALVLTQDHGLQEYGERMSPADAKVMQMVLAVRSMAPGVPIIAELVEERHGEFVSRLGASTFVSDETIVSRMIAQSAMKPGVSRIIFSMLTASAETCEPYFLGVPRGLIGVAFGDAYARVAGHGLVLLAVEKRKRGLLVNPSRDTIVEEGDKLVVLSRDEATAERALGES